MNSIDWAIPGNLKGSSWYGEQFHAVYDRIVPGGEVAEQTADFLMGMAGRADPSILELGVGTGRIALPLARRGAVVTGVDASALMLDVCRAAPHGADLRLVEADIRTWRPDQKADLVCCICATLTCLATVEDQRQAMRVIASAARPGGTVVIENHNPGVVRLLHGERSSVELKLPLAEAPAPADALSLLDEDKGVWQMEYRWTEADGTSEEAVERVLLTGPDDVIRMAAEVGLSWRATYGDWTGGPEQLLNPTYVCVFSAPDTADAA